MKTLHPRLFPLYFYLIIFMAIQILIRSILTAFNLDLLSPPWIVDLFKIFASGAYFDLLAFSYLAAPWAVLLLLPPDKIANSRIFKFIALAILFAGTSILVFSAVGEWFFWEEFNTRYNFIAVDYLIYTTEVIGNIRESYPMWAIYLPVLCVPAVVFLLSYRLIAKYWNLVQATALVSRLGVLSVILIAPVLSFYVLGNIFNTVSTNVIVDDLGKNGIYQIFSAYRLNNIDYATFYRTLPENEVASVMSEEGIIPRDIQTSNPLPYKPNVIFIVVESLGAKFFKAFGNNSNITPHLDQLMENSLTFTNLYATGTRTVRGLEALMLSIPPTPGNSVVRRPDNENLFSLGHVLKENGYQNQFIYGGYGLFDNMNYFFDHNHFSLLDRNDFSSAEINFANIWGVCDSDVFTRILKEADLSSSTNQPFFKFILTTSNHRPYTYPEGLIDIPSKTGRDGGVKYTDYAINDFIEKARTRSWFDRTIFVVIADHSVGGRGTSEISVGDFHIPLIIYAPKFIAAGKVETIASQIDVTPTLLNLMGLSYHSKFFGKDILGMDPSKGRFFSGTYSTVGLFRGGRFVSLKLKKKISFMDFEIATGAPGVKPSDDDLEKEVISNYQHAYNLLKNNLYRP
jgi:phosphoglycerol transferase MdoB-like AlkP superfamily enzyme